MQKCTETLQLLYSTGKGIIHRSGQDWFYCQYYTTDPSAV